MQQLFWPGGVTLAPGRKLFEGAQSRGVAVEKPAKPLRILIVDDHTALRRNVRALLSSLGDWSVCGEAGDGVEAIEKAKDLRPDVLLMDVSMPRMNGLEATRIIRKEVPESKILIVSQNDPLQVQQQAVDVDAHGYVDKANLARDLIPAVKQVSRPGEADLTATRNQERKSWLSGAHDYLVKPFSARELVARVETHLKRSRSERESEERERESERRFRQMLDALPAAIYTTDAEGRLTHFNPAAVEFSGRVPELGSDKWCVSWKIFAADGTALPHDQCPMALAIKEGRVEEGGEFIAERPDGTRIWFTPYPRLLRDAGNRIIGGINMLLDITQRKEAEQELRESHSLRQTAMDAGNLGAWEWDIQRNKVTWTDRIYEFHGLEPGSFAGTVEAFAKLVHPDDLPGVQRALEEALAGKAEYHVEFRAVRPDGEIRWLFTRAEVVRDGGGKPLRMIGMTQDISERKQAERTTSLLAAIVGSSDDAIISKNLNGVITSWNHGAERLFGYTSKEAIGQHITMIIPPGRRHEETMIIERLKRGERVEHFQTVRMRKDGTLLDISLAISPIKDSSGKVIGASKVARDVTEHKRIERALAAGGAQQRALFLFADQLHRALSVDEVYTAALEAIVGALQCPRASILLYDERKVMRFVSWRGLSEAYRKATEGHSPWKPGDAAPEPVCINDTNSADFDEALKATVKAEGIAALAFIPLVSHGKLIGKFMAYFDTPHAFTKDEIDLSLTISRQLAFGIDRKLAEDEVRRSEERFRKLAETLEAEVRIRTRELEQRNTDVIRQSERLRDLSQRLMESRDDERRHIAQELHDSAGQTLTVLAMNLSRVAHEAEQSAPQLVKEAQQNLELVQQLSQEIRTMSYLLHPPLLDESGLTAALSWYVRGLTERSGLDIQLNISEEFGRLPRELELAVFRLVQECLTNIHRHSDSKTAIIQVARDAENILLEVRDEGKGISAERLAEIQSQGSGVGIRGMRERVRKFEGEMSIESDEAGTKVSVRLPAPEADPAAESGMAQPVDAA